MLALSILRWRSFTMMRTFSIRQRAILLRGLNCAKACPIFGWFPIRPSPISSYIELPMRENRD